MNIVILRLGHRLKRDERLSTHVGLTARALGCDEIIYSGDKDKNLYENLRKTSKRWGGNFKISYEKIFKKILRKYKKKNYKLIHLTMYGEPVMKKISKIRKNNLLVIVGSGKVPGEIYENSDYNISVTNQPHSEVSALAIFLHEYFQGKGKKFSKSEIKIIPMKKGKNVIEKNKKF